ncbi:SWIM zinc finger family protein [Paenibacillus cremeus]|uniref:SWIM-type domain-containing protein n=1 Tax=Paenibacillus cremeus TaxID=2163881 RepID=A0A559K918_9BACL|nr:SWIM zinc finger family protein [Paenibacillus cremeus]TVY08626.1 hypothetical protein FPZ49_17505 [Paenibacillus cremeus]
MSSNPVLNDELWPKLLQQVAAAFNEVTLNRGYNYFKQQYVTRMVRTEDRVIEAEVTGSDEYLVKLKLDKVSSSSCTCPVQDCCKHMAAVLMELADRHGYPASQLVNAKHHLKRAAETAASSKSQLGQLPEKDVSGWHAFLEEYTSHIKPTSYDQRMYADVLRSQLQGIRNVPYSAADGVYFELHQELFRVRKVKELTAQATVHYYSSYAFFRVYDELHTWLQYKSSLFDFTVAEDRLSQTLSYVRQQMAEDNGKLYLDYGLYTAMWKLWIAPKGKAVSDHWATQELQAMETQAGSNAMSLSLSAAKAFLYLCQSRGTEAWETLESSGMLKQATGSLLLPFLEQMAAAGDWGTLVDWLIRTASSFYGPRTKELDGYIDYWKQAVGHVPDAEKALWDVMEDMLPHSASIIEHLLYERRQWKPWIELQIVQEHDPLYHRVSVLQPIEKDNPSLLLPYYHQAIDRYVALKNRQDYKSAVKLLKRLEKLYKKLKQPERWDRFLTGFTDRYNRLRALQEEMKKGKLLQ